MGLTTKVDMKATKSAETRADGEVIITGKKAFWFQILCLPSVYQLFTSKDLQKVALVP